MILSSPVRVVVVDDEPAIRTDVTTLLKQQANFIVIGSCKSVQEALVLIPATEPDLLLLDISLGDGTGFDILEKLLPSRFKVIFLTAHEEHALRAIKVGALDYLLKPINGIELKQALEKVQATTAEQVSLVQSNFKQTPGPSRIVLRSQQFMQVVDVEDIRYCQGSGGCTNFYLSEKRTFMTTRHLKEYEEMLPSSTFIRPHQSYLVNNNFIDKYHRDGYLILKDGTEIPVATRRSQRILDFFNSYQ